VEDQDYSTACKLCDKCRLPMTARLQDIPKSAHLGYRQTSHGHLEHIVDSLPCVRQAEIDRARQLGLVRVVYSKKAHDAMRLAASVHDAVQFVVCVKPDSPWTEDKPDSPWAEDKAIYALYVSPASALVLNRLGGGSRTMHDLAKEILEAHGQYAADLIQMLRAAETLRMWDAENAKSSDPQSLT